MSDEQTVQQSFTCVIDAIVVLASFWLLCSSAAIIGPFAIVLDAMRLGLGVRTYQGLHDAIWLNRPRIIGGAGATPCSIWLSMLLVKWRLPRTKFVLIASNFGRASVVVRSFRKLLCLQTISILHDAGVFRFAEPVHPGVGFVVLFFLDPIFGTTKIKPVFALRHVRFVVGDPLAICAVFTVFALFLMKAGAICLAFRSGLISKPPAPFHPAFSRIPVVIALFLLGIVRMQVRILQNLHSECACDHKKGKNSGTARNHGCNRDKKLQGTKS